MKKISGIILGIWCAFTSFITPIWLTMAFLNVTGLIYKYDYSMDDGTAGIIGFVILILWLLAVLLPDILLLRYVKTIHVKGVRVTIGIMIGLMVICIAVCNWDIIAFLMK